jgi:mRNA-degrading endonuclease RelE of RelBE toxin-antitoxin system
LQTPFGEPGIKPLKNAKNAFRIRVGEYRIGLKKEEDVIEVMRVLHRKDIYRFFP